ILVIDNYDSFTYNIVQILGELGAEVEVVRNDAVSAEEAMGRPFEAVIISPGPGTPSDAGISCEVIRRLGEEGRRPLLGVCMGHECIAEAFGGKVVRGDRLMHGKVSPVYHDNRTVYKGLENPFDATRYHSLIVEEASLPECLEVTAWTREGEIMGLRHRTLPIEGVQFHPESVMTDEGRRLLQNFITRAR
ncbi:MAG: aminodeoxychorismate/anthranilate synthase component II, partial [Armatimonadetes bacterium]|nr:aminodeoxychorismate/anthranilate synthase component II [Armatimonadota bacterium]